MPASASAPTAPADERWADIHDTQGRYLVSNLGRVRHCRARAPLAQHIGQRHGYLFVTMHCLRAPGDAPDAPRNLYRLVHRLVAQAFVPNPDPARLRVVDHINRNKHDNRADNLRWCDMSTNAQNKAKTTKPTSSRYIGVSRTPGGRWRVHLKHRRRDCHIRGSFGCEHQAALAYDAAALALFGPLASVNFPLTQTPPPAAPN
jgi:hypothetical protein